MKKLALHSGHVDGNTLIDEAALELIGSDSPKIAYIPSQSDIERKYYTEQAERYKQLGVKEILYFDIDQEYDETKIDELLACHAIFLSGGNTFYFLNSLQKRNFIPLLQNFVDKGGVLIGASAGSIIMSKTIDIMEIMHEEEDDENEVGLKDLTALGLTNFDFYPHYNESDEAINKKLKEYSSKYNTTVYACKDGTGIIIDGDEVRLIGDVIKFTY